MKTIVLQEPGRFSRVDAPGEPEAGTADAIVRVRAVGICGTDLHAYRGRQPFFSYPRILGHELGVEVLEVGPQADGVRPGDRCAVEPYLACGTCGPCRRGRTNCCETLQVLGVHIDGGMRERIAVPAAKLHPSPTLGFEALALVETLGIGAHAVARGAPVAGERVLVVGAGPIGLSAVAFALLADAEVWVLEPDAGRRRFCSDRFGVRGCIAPGGDPPAEVRAALGGELPTLVLDATGNADAMRASFRLVASAGRLVLVGIVRGEIAFDDPEFHRRELSLLATRNSTAAEFQRIVRLMENGLIDTGPWITHRAGYDTLVEEFPTWLDRESGVVKAMLAL